MRISSHVYFCFLTFKFRKSFVFVSFSIVRSVLCRSTCSRFITRPYPSRNYCLSNLYSTLVYTWASGHHSAFRPSAFFALRSCPSVLFLSTLVPEPFFLFSVRYLLHVFVTVFVRWFLSVFWKHRDWKAYDFLTSSSPFYHCRTGPSKFADGNFFFVTRGVWKLLFIVKKNYDFFKFRISNTERDLFAKIYHWFKWNYPVRPAILFLFVFALNLHFFFFFMFRPFL